MRISKEGLTHIKKFEGWRSCVYRDVAGIPTIGYGFTFYPSTGNKVTVNDPCITLKQGETILLSMLLKFEAGVNSLVKQALTNSQFSALVSFSYNVGLGAFSKSTLLKTVNKNPNDFEEIKTQLLRWVKAGGKVHKGLKRRRNSEYWLYSQDIREQLKNQKNG